MPWEVEKKMLCAEPLKTNSAKVYEQAGFHRATWIKKYEEKKSNQTVVLSRCILMKNKIYDGKRSALQVPTTKAIKKHN